jgi:hypothetical protein
MLSRLPLVAAIGAVLLLTACGPAAPTAPTPSASGVATSTPAPPPPAPSAAATPTPSPSAAATVFDGTCTAAEMAASGGGYAIPTVFTVYNSLASDPMTIHYTAFNFDGTLPVETITSSAPVVNIVGYSCSTASQGATWVLTASHSTPGSLGCALDFGGLLVNTASAGQEEPHITISCSGNPGE